MALERELRSGAYWPGRYRKIEVFDPKHRIVSAVPFRDWIVHHALHAVLGEIFEREFIFNFYANRRGRRCAAARYEKFRIQFRYVLRCDIYRYFLRGVAAIAFVRCCLKLSLSGASEEPAIAPPTGFMSTKLRDAANAQSQPS